jgi:hypothetical protein
VLGTSQLHGAALSLASAKGGIAILTGFCATHADPPAAETDGPPGALYLARGLIELGRDVVLVSDRFGMPLLRVGAEQWGLAVRQFEIPMKGTRAAVGKFASSAVGRGLSHLVSIERAGPSHTIASLARQSHAGPVPRAAFTAQVPRAHRGVCHNMRGKIIDRFTAPAHRLIDVFASLGKPLVSIGVGDGGNEIGMGAIPWEVLRDAIAIGPGARVACGIPTDFLIVAGVSDFGAYGLACAVAVAAGKRRLIGGWGTSRQRALVECLVRDAGAVDGVTGERAPSVDSLALNDYLAQLGEIEAAACAK